MGSMLSPGSSSPCTALKICFCAAVIVSPVDCGTVGLLPPHKLLGNANISPPLYHSSLLFQLHCSHGDCIVSGLPRGLWKQPQLCVADHLWAWHQNTPGLQWFWPGAPLWLPDDQRWGPIWSYVARTLLWGWSSFTPDFQQQRSAAGVSGWSLDVWTWL